MTKSQTYYEVLGVDVDASTSDIVAACDRVTMRYRTDLQMDPSGELANIAMQRIAALEEIRDTLLDPRQRYLYDRSLGLLIQPPPPSAGAPAVATDASPVRRELIMVILGGLIGLVIVAIVWVASAQLATPNMPAAAETNRPATNFTLPKLGGETLTLSDYKGKIVVLNFWGTWCEPCKAETPALEEAYKQLSAQNVEFIGINLRHQESPGIQGDLDVANFVKQYGVSYPVVFDVKGEIAQKYQISPIPVSYFIDAQGNVRYVYVGTLTTQDTLELVKRLQNS